MIPLRFISWFSLVALALPHHYAQSNERTNTRGLGMARTSVASSKGLDAVGINPAGLAANEDGTVTLSFLPIGLHVGSDFLDYEIYTSYFTGEQTDSGRVSRYLTESDKQRILNGIGRDVARTTADAEAGLFGVSFHLKNIGGIAFTVNERQNGYAAIPRDYAQFLLYGNPPGSIQNFHETEIRASWMREYALSLGFTLPAIRFLESLSFGAAAKLVHGYGFYSTERFNVSLNTADNGTLHGRVDFLARSAGIDPYENGGFESLKLFSKPAGRGYAFDFGVAGAVNNALSFGVALTDVGSIRWHSNARETIADTTIDIDDPFAVEEGDAVKQALKGRKREIGSFKSELPTTIRVGVALAVHKLPSFEKLNGLLIGLDVNKGLYETPGSTKRLRVSFGVEYLPIRWLPLRSGVSFGGTDHFNVAFGVGVHLGLFDLDLASENVTWLFAPKKFSYGSAAIGMRFRI